MNIFLLKNEILSTSKDSYRRRKQNGTGPKLFEKLESYINKVKAEATYFFEADGNRVASFIVDIESADQIPVLTEPLFSGMGAHVELHPLMSLDDLKKGIPQAIVEANSYRY
jgi:hypothetical protein